MLNTLAHRSPPSFNLTPIKPSPLVDHYGTRGQKNEDVDHQFITLLNAYRRSGGLAQAQEVAAMFQSRPDCKVTTLANWIVYRKVICFEWQSKMWLPLFQFDSLDMSPKPGLKQVLEELAPNYDHWALANWFAQPNAWLMQRTPADTFDVDLSAVLDAAHADKLTNILPMYASAQIGSSLLPTMTT
jgi:hypothetical protein